MRTQSSPREVRPTAAPRRSASGTTEERSAVAGIVGKPFVVEEFLAAVKGAVERPIPPKEAIDDASAEAITVFPDLGQHLVTDWPTTDLLATVVHELRAPLTVMRGHAQLARRYLDQKPERVLGAIDSAIVQMDRMARLISELLNESRLSSNALSLNVVAFDLVDAVAGAKERHEYGGRRAYLRSPKLRAVRE